MKWIEKIIISRNPKIDEIAPRVLIIFRLTFLQDFVKK